MAFFPQLDERFDQLVESLQGRPVQVLGHARPDGDCIGAQVALTRLLCQNGVPAVALNADPIPEALAFLKGVEDIATLDAVALSSAPLIFVDCADENRVGSEASALLGDKHFAANIDHHISNTEYAERNIVESTASATCEILAGLAFDKGWSIDAVTAQALFTGIMTDTGRFGYPATSSRVFALCGKVVDCGAKPHLTAQSLYEDEPFSRLMLLQRFLGNLRTEFDGLLGTGKLLSSDFEETGATYEQTEGFVDYTRAIRGAMVGLYLEERKTTVKVSLRAISSQYRVDRIAKQFGGGGHAAAAAFSTHRPIEEVESMVIAAIGERLRALDSERSQEGSRHQKMGD